MSERCFLFFSASFPSQEEKIEADSRSIYVGNVSNLNKLSLMSVLGVFVSCLFWLRKSHKILIPCTFPGMSRTMLLDYKANMHIMVTTSMLHDINLVIWRKQSACQMETRTCSLKSTSIAWEICVQRRACLCMFGDAVQMNTS